MTNIEIILVLIMAGGFGYIITKLKRIEDIASLSVSMQLGNVIIKDAEEEEEDE